MVIEIKQAENGFMLTMDEKDEYVFIDLNALIAFMVELYRGEDE